MAKTGESMTAAPPRPTITLPPRPSMEALFSGGFGVSPGPMTLVSSFLSPDSSCSFSQLLADAMFSPLAHDARPTNFFPDTTVLDNYGKAVGSEEATGKVLGFKQSRPMSLVVAPSPLFTIPPGLSPSGLLSSPGFFPPHSPFGMSHQQALAQVTAEAVLAQQSQIRLQADYRLPPTVTTRSEALALQPSLNPSEGSDSQMVPSTSNSKNSAMASAEASRANKSFQSLPLIVDKPADDGFNWRKYGQKQVKGSECSRSYYNCSHLNCPVKKKVARSLDGQITEIIYKGQHNHVAPQPNKRGRDGSNLNANADVGAGNELGSQNWGGNSNVSGEMVLAQSVPSGLGSNQDMSVLPGSSDSKEVIGAGVKEKEDYHIEPPSKRRNTESGDCDLPISHKIVTEPKIVVQTRSEVDLLDDGYRWRKYGQKVVKGNPHPRSYYKCTSAGCNVRKHVERASKDPTAVITTYEGKHTHDIPLGRNSCHSTVHANAMTSKPGRVFPEKHYLLKDVDFEMIGQSSEALILKEEQITVR